MGEMGGTGGALVFLTIAGGFFGFMLLLAFLTVSIRAPRRIRDYGWPIETDARVPVLDVLLGLVWGVIIVAALLSWPLTALAIIVASIPFVFGSELMLPEILRDVLTAELVYAIVIAASLVVGLALFVALLVSDLIGERLSARKRPFVDERFDEHEQSRAPAG
jgi:hypothetical protein